MSISVTRQMFGSADAIDSRWTSIVVRPAVRRSESPREEVHQCRVRFKIVGHVNRFHARNLSRMLKFYED